MSEPLIVQVIKKYHPDWQAPKENGRTWVKCLCPFHAETRPSAGISYEHDSFNCLGCGVKGTAAGIIRLQEGVTNSEANRIAEAIPVEGIREVPAKPPRVSGRRVFGEPRTDAPGDPSVRPGVRRRPPPWARDV